MVPGMGAQGLVAPALTGAGTGLSTGAAGAAGMGGAQGLMGTIASAPEITAPFASASPDSFRMAYTVGDGMKAAGKGAEYGGKAMNAMNMASPQQPNRQIGQMPYQGQQAQQMSGLLADPSQERKMRRLRNLGLLG